ncbi:MAG: NADH-quinone oxidoreductase subunit H, partial [Elusimicrobiales bacterium]|nr:NADH-quinone oxidoreductase subunit H [Elusimicrobiales bacterium]
HGSMRFAAFMFAEYVEIILFSMLASIFFFGGWQVPYLNDQGFNLGSFFIPINHYLIVLMQLASFALKTVFFSVLVIMIRWTLPRFRFDQIMRLCWANLLPISVLNLLLTALIIRGIK